MRLGALEAGGTKMVCAIGNANGEIYERISIPTETPEITVPKMIEYFKEKDIQALGIGCFGPIDLNRKSETYGYITTTPKLAWKNYNIVRFPCSVCQIKFYSLHYAFHYFFEKSAFFEYS